MPVFSYRAANAAGRTVRGTEEAVSPDALERTLGARGLFPLEVGPAAESPRPRRRGFRSRRAAVAEAVRYLATLVDAGFPLDRALGAVARVAAREDVAEALSRVRGGVRGGMRLDAALAEHPEVFPRFAVGMARAGESGGHLAVALERLADQMEREDALRARILGALLYPAVMVMVGVGALVVLFLYVLPRFTGMLADAGAELPRSTAFLLAGTEFMARWWWAVLGVPLLASLVLSFLRGSEAGRMVSDRLLLRTPVLGGVRRRASAARVGRSLATLLRSGMPILTALEITAGAQTDAVVAAGLMQAREEVRAGSRLADALGRSDTFPFLFLQMAEVGEEGGRLPEMLDRAAAAMEGELERSLDRMVRMVEPAMILLFGGVVGFVALALLQAIYGIRADAF